MDKTSAMVIHVYQLADKIKSQVLKEIDEMEKEELLQEEEMYKEAIEIWEEETERRLAEAEDMIVVHSRDEYFTGQGPDEEDDAKEE